MWLSWWPWRKRQYIERLDRIDGLTTDEVTELATYNSERARGLQHTFDKDRRMAELQARFDEPYTEIAARRQREHDERVERWKSSRVANRHDKQE